MRESCKIHHISEANFWTVLGRKIHSHSLPDICFEGFGGDALYLRALNNSFKQKKEGFSKLDTADHKDKLMSSPTSYMLCLRLNVLTYGGFYCILNILGSLLITCSVNTTEVCQGFCCASSSHVNFIAGWFTSDWLNVNAKSWNGVLGWAEWSFSCSIKE